MGMEKATVPRDWYHWKRTPRATGAMVSGAVVMAAEIRIRTHRNTDATCRYFFDPRVYDVRREEGVSVQ